MPLGSDFAATRAAATVAPTAVASTTPDSAGRKAVTTAGTQGAPATGGSVTKHGAEAGGEKSLPRDGAAKKAKVMSLIPRDDIYALLYIGGNVGNPGFTAFQTENFLLQQVQMQASERHQIVETFQKALIYFMGKAPEIYQYSGVLINADAPADGAAPRWRDQFILNWETKLRGTVCTENQTRVFLDYNGLLVSGYMLNYALSENAEDPSRVNFTFSLYVTDVKVLGG